MEQKVVVTAMERAGMENRSRAKGDGCHEKGVGGIGDMGD